MLTSEFEAWVLFQAEVDSAETFCCYDFVKFYTYSYMPSFDCGKW